MDSLGAGQRHGRALGLFLWLGIVFLAGCLVPPVVLLWWLLDGTPPLDDPTARFVRWDERDPEVALVEWRSVRNRSCPGVAYRWLIGDRVWELPAEPVPYAGSTETFGNRESRWTVAVRIPRTALLEPWPMSYRVSFEWACNPLQRWLPIEHTVPDVMIPAPATAFPDAVRDGPPPSPPGRPASREDRPPP